MVYYRHLDSWIDAHAMGYPDVNQRLTIGELVKRSGTTTKTIRYYERIGLIQTIGLKAKTP